jgi:hypothetical protein
VIKVTLETKDLKELLDPPVLLDHKELTQQHLDPLGHKEQQEIKVLREIKEILEIKDRKVKQGHKVFKGYKG